MVLLVDLLLTDLIDLIDCSDGLSSQAVHVLIAWRQCMAIRRGGANLGREECTFRSRGARVMAICCPGGAGEGGACWLRLVGVLDCHWFLKRTNHTELDGESMCMNEEREGS